MVAKTVKPEEQRSIQSKEKILKAAEKIFAQKGLHCSRIDGIAKLSKVNKQRIYAYFGSKAKLYRQVLLNVYSQAANNERLTSLTEKDIPDKTFPPKTDPFKMRKNSLKFDFEKINSKDWTRNWRKVSCSTAGKGLVLFFPESPTHGFSVRC